MFSSEAFCFDGSASDQLERCLVGTRSPGIGITAHVEVVMVDVDDFHTFFIFQGVWNWPTVDRTLFEVNGALVVSMVQLSEPNQRNEPWIVNVVSNLLFDDADLVPLLFVEQGNSTADRTSTLESVDDFVIARWIDRSHRTATSQRTHDRNTCVSLVNVKLDFLAVL